MCIKFRQHLRQYQLKKFLISLFLILLFEFFQKFGSSRCQPLKIMNLWRAVSVIHLLYNSGTNIGVTANKSMFSKNAQTLFFILNLFPPFLNSLLMMLISVEGEVGAL